MYLFPDEHLEEVAALLGDAPDTIREHYAQIRSHEPDLKAAALDEDA